MQMSFLLLVRLLVLTSLVASVLAFASAWPNHEASAASHPVIWGDVTCDSVVNLQDVGDLMRRASGLETSTSCPGDGGLAVSISAAAATMTLRLDPAAASAAPGETVTMAIFSDVHTPGVGIGHASFDVVFDPYKLTPVSCSANNGDCNLTFRPNTTRFGFLSGSGEGWTGTRKLGQVQYLVGGSAGQSTKLTFQAIIVGDQKGVPISTEAMGATISIGASGSTPTPAPTSAPTATPGPTTPPGAYWYYADINCDGSITVLDALGVLEYFAVGHSSQVVTGSCPTIGS